MWTFSLWALLPPIYSVVTAAGLWLVYFVAVKNKKIVPLSLQYRKRNDTLYPPYISLAGNAPPASCIFTEVMNLAAFVGLIIGILRYLQLKHRLNKPWLNVGSLVALSIGCFGMMLVGNFQFGVQELIHNVGACVTFGLGTMFCWMQSYITLKVNLNNEGRKVGILRFLLSGSITLCMILYYILMSQHLHTHAARCQWTMVMFFLFFFSTLGIEFRLNRFYIECVENSGQPVRLPETLSEASEPNQL